jgi:hypothetical protein
MAVTDPSRPTNLLDGLAKLIQVGSTDSKIQAARRLLESGTLAREVAHRRVGPYVVSLGARLFTDVKDLRKRQARADQAIRSGLSYEKD